VTEHSDIASPAQGDGQQPTGSEPQSGGWAPPGGTGQESPVPSAAFAGQRPEVMVGAAFAGGLLAALILKRLAR
jgi:hypothetical protein